MKHNEMLHAMTPLFSVITVSLNAGIALRQTVESALHQSCGDFELLVKDGGSKDGSLDLVPNDPRVRIVTAPDRGIFDAMNQALDLCTGRFIHFLNAADFYVDDRVLEDVAAEIGAAPETEFFYGDVIFPGFSREYIRYPSRLSRYFLHAHMLCHQGWFVSRQAYLRLGKFKLGAKSGGDQVFLYDAILGERMAYRHIPRFIARYDVHGFSSSLAVQAQSHNFRHAIRCKYYPAWERCLYRGVWRARSAARAVLSMPPFLHVFRRLQKLRFGGRPGKCSGRGAAKAT